jgi:hypothetical protein
MREIDELIEILTLSYHRQWRLHTPKGRCVSAGFHRILHFSEGTLRCLPCLLNGYKFRSASTDRKLLLQTELLELLGLFVRQKRPDV